ncbi:hypothetical protein PIB30_086346 [Stylosanthes scabra]|uniref:Uncharacterized protein n=1 Tax=Stylosanthes scabra TaxID=79078 RepID=A0ABU6WRF4_9FABA|nr:hypothetical protein [Stylosanthes scabra]
MEELGGAAPHGVKGYAGEAIEFRNVCLLLVICSGRIWVEENGKSLIEDDGHIMAGKACNVRVATFLERPGNLNDAPLAEELAPQAADEI